MASSLQDLITVIGYMLPACMIVSVIIGMVFWVTRINRKSMDRANEWVQLSRDIKNYWSSQSLSSKKPIVYYRNGRSAIKIDSASKLHRILATHDNH